MIHCCEEMTGKLDFQCDLHEDPWDCADSIILYFENTGWYGLPIRDGGRSFIVIKHCPWCGVKLPDEEKE